MSLHCEATLLVMGDFDALAHRDALRARRVAAVYATSPGSPAAVRLGAELGVPVAGVELQSGQGWAFVHANEAVLQGVSDLFRGETVLVLVSEPDAPEPCKVAAGDDGWSLHTWSPD